MTRIRLLAPLLVAVFALLTPDSPAAAGDTLIRVKNKGRVRCGVSDGIPGFSQLEADGRWTGMDVDFCRGLAAAVLGDSNRVTFLPLAASERFPSLKAGEIDVLARNTTWTLEREALLELLFAGVYYFDGQGFLVPAASGVRELSRLNGASICVVKGSTHQGNLVDYFAGRDWQTQTVLVESQAEAAEALFSGRCFAFTSERPQLTAMRLKAPSGPAAYVLLPEWISMEPMGPVVRRGDDEWFTLVRWVLFALIRAEELNLSQSSVRARLATPSDARVQRWHAVDGAVAKALGIPPGWTTRLVETAGHYGEVFERNLGSGSSLQFERGPNRLWTQGGLLYAPPLH